MTPPPGHLALPGPSDQTDQADPAELANPFLAQIVRLNLCADSGTMRLRHVSVTMRRAQVMLDEASQRLRLSNLQGPTSPPVTRNSSVTY